MAKHKDQRFDHKGRYVPMLDRLKASRESWQDNAPRLTEDQKRKVQNIVRAVYSRHMNDQITRKTFNKIHERIEEEVYDAIRNNLDLVAALEWRVIFGESAIRYFQKMGMENPAHVDGILPTDGFVLSDLFDYVEVFEPVVTLQTFDNYDKFMKSAEQSIDEAEKRRKMGDAYFTDLDKAINYRAEVGISDALDNDE